ncbi:zinc finger protein 501-like [Hyaena hyaena]|uniref:zinc finger protein 501-like n=1 Tax=Hyaena hyaena TaxID=95912 RepID=UPI0019220B3B|nr:zinc finger protein 501-like [Hyaena hyaena]
MKVPADLGSGETSLPGLQTSCLLSALAHWGETKKPVILKDVAMDFTQEEWGLLGPTQRILHHDMMLRNYSNLVSLGLLNCKPDVISKLEQWEDPWAMERDPLRGPVDRSFQGNSSVAKHQQVHTGEKPYVYGECGRVFSQSTYLVQHHRGEWPCECHTCCKAFSLSSSLADHEHCHTGEKLYTFRECGRAFSQSSSLSKHLRTHTSEKPYARSDCGRAFSQSSSLAKHQQVHTSERPCVCGECGKTFSQSSYPTQQLKIHSGEKPFTCSECRKRFGDSSALVLHQRVHRSEQPYACRKCRKTFRQSRLLTRHKRIHTEEKPYVCGDCGRAFVQSSSFTHHLRTHTREKAYKCNECGKAYVQVSHLTEHCRVYTGERPTCAMRGVKPSAAAHTSCSTSRPPQVPSPSYAARVRKPSVRLQPSFCIRGFTPDKPFECHKYGKAFSWSRSLARLWRVHSQGMPCEYSNYQKTLGNC